MNLHQYLILNSRDYFAIAEEYCNLNKVFKKDTFLEKLSLWVDMVFYPLAMILLIVVYNMNLVSLVS
jgi:hypothetical protein